LIYTESESYCKVLSPSLKQGKGEKDSSSDWTRRIWINDFVFTGIFMIPFTSSDVHALGLQYVVQELAVLKPHLLISKGRIWTAVLQ